MGRISLQLGSFGKSMNYEHDEPYQHRRQRHQIVGRTPSICYEWCVEENLAYVHNFHGFAQPEAILEICENMPMQVMQALKMFWKWMWWSCSSLMENTFRMRTDAAETRLWWGEKEGEEGPPTLLQLTTKQLSEAFPYFDGGLQILDINVAIKYPQEYMTRFTAAKSYTKRKRGIQNGYL